MPLPTITATGRLGDDVELRFTPSGKAVATFSLACNDRRKNQTGQWEDGDTVWYRVTCWDRLAENAADQLTKGIKVTVTGRHRLREYEKDGQRRHSNEITAETVARPIQAQNGQSATTADRTGAYQPSDPWGDANAPQAGTQSVDQPPF